MFKLTVFMQRKAQQEVKKDGDIRVYLDMKVINMIYINMTCAPKWTYILITCILN